MRSDRRAWMINILKINFWAHDSNHYRLETDCSIGVACSEELKTLSALAVLREGRAIKVICWGSLTPKNVNPKKL